MKQGEKPAKVANGFFVASHEIPVHRKGMGIGVPYRIPYGKFRTLAKLTDINPNEMTADEVMASVDKAIEWIRGNIKIYWNWEDGEGEPLDQPADNPEVYDQLSIDEINWLLDHITDSTTIPPPKRTA
jgi:hypothetical protein